MGRHHWYDDELFAQPQPLTAESIGKILCQYGADAVTSLRGRKDLIVTIVGTTQGAKGRLRRNLYKVEKREQSDVTMAMAP